MEKTQVLPVSETARRWAGEPRADGHAVRVETRLHRLRPQGGQQEGRVVDLVECLDLVERLGERGDVPAAVLPQATFDHLR